MLVAGLVCVALLLGCLFQVNQPAFPKRGKPVVPEGRDRKDFAIEPSKRRLKTFEIPVVEREPAVITAQVCFILDEVHGKHEEQINQTESSCRKIVDAVKAMAFDHMPGATVDLGMTAIGYNDWDEETAKRNRPVVFAYGGSEIKKNDPDISLTEFNLRGKFAKDTDDMKWIKRPGRGKEPEKLPGAFLAATCPGPQTSAWPW